MEQARGEERRLTLKISSSVGVTYQTSAGPPMQRAAPLVVVRWRASEVYLEMRVMRTLRLLWRTLLRSALRKIDCKCGGGEVCAYFIDGSAALSGATSQMESLMILLATVTIWMDEHETASARHAPQWRSHVTCEGRAQAAQPGPGARAVGCQCSVE